MTGASSGIGAATARHLALAGFDVVVGARRLDRLRAVAEPIGARALPLDVTDAASVVDFCARIGPVSVLVNNAGGALGLDPVADADEEQWRTMYDTNVLGVMRVTRALLPRLVESGDGHVVTDIDPATTYRTTGVGAPVFGPTGAVELSITIATYEVPLTGADLAARGEAVRAAADAVTTGIGGSPPR